MATVESEVEVGSWTRTKRTSSRWAARHEAPLRAFEQERRSLQAIAARILGSAPDAEDLVQEVFIRWQGVNHRTIRNPAAFLTRVVTRLSLNEVKSAHRRRIEYVGHSPPEGEVAAGAGGAHHLEEQELTEDLSAALGRILERLTPMERAVFLLHECFGYGYAEIASIVNRSEDNCRQIERRARQHLLGRARSRPVDPAKRERLLGLFVRASRGGEVGDLVDTLAREAAEYAAAKRRFRQ